MSLLKAMSVAGSALRAQRTRMDTISSNLANADSTRTAEGGPYRRKDPLFAPQRAAFDAELGQAAAQGVDVVGIVEDTRPPKMVYDPDHPDSDDKGYVAMPNVNVVEEMVDMISASRSYEAATSAVRTVKAMANAAMEIGS